MSLATIKQKETKGKKNVLRKLRTIVANPYKQHSPVLPENEMREFQNILKVTMSENKLTQKTFATQSQIKLGLESTLRAINQKHFSCVFVSLSLRPSHLIRLIATSAAVKVPTAPIYAQPKLEELTHEIFGVRALALVLPLDLNKISSELDKWVTARKKLPVKQRAFEVASAKKRKLKVEHVQEVEEKKNVAEIKEVADIKKVAEIEKQVVEKQWSGDYISCTNDEAALKLDQVDVQVETQQLGAALNILAKKAQSKTKSTENKTNTASKASTALPVIERMAVDSEDDEFLPANLSKYQPLTVLQICANPDKKPKKKRNKKKQQTPPAKTK